MDGTNTNGGNMSNGFSTGDAVLTAAMSGGFGRGGGLWGEYGGYGSMYANPASIQHAVKDSSECNREVFKQSINGINSTLEGLQRDNQFMSTNTNISNGFNRLCDRLMENSRQTADSFFQSELRQGDRMRDLQAEMNANARAAAECCCELKLKMCEDKAELLAAIAAQGQKTTERELDRAEREIIFLKSQHHHHGG